jgi:probable rRNA maturation factor
MDKVEAEVIIEDPRWEEELSKFKFYPNKITLRTIRLAGLSFAQEVQVSFFLTNDEEIRKINKEYRGQDKATNVLSFPQEHEELEDKLPILYIGDIFLSLDTLRKEIENTDKSFKDHLLHLMVHGILHLLSFDHEEEAQAEEMEKIEIEILESFNIKSPYETKL